jgi:hypothetical protein
MFRDTGELINQLNSESNIKSFIAEYENTFIKKPLVQYLNELLNKYQIKKAEVISKSGIAAVYGYQIFDGRREPKRDKVIQIAIGFGLSLEETQKLLRNAGYNELYPRNRRDVLLIYSINNRLDIVQVEKLLFEMGEVRMHDI